MHLQVLNDGVLHLLEKGESPLWILGNSMLARVSISGQPEVKFVSKSLPDEFSVSDELRSDRSHALRFRTWQVLTGQDTTLVIYNGDCRHEARVIVSANPSDEEETPFG